MSDALDRTAPILLLRPVTLVMPQALPAAPWPGPSRPAPPEETVARHEPGRRARQQRARWYGYRAIVVVAALALAELLYLLLT